MLQVLKNTSIARMILRAFANQWWKSRAAWAFIVRLGVLVAGAYAGFEVSTEQEAVLVGAFTAIGVAITEVMTAFEVKKAKGPKIRKPAESDQGHPGVG